MIRARREGGVAVVSFDRPQMRNALTPVMFDALGQELDTVEAAGEAMVLTGVGKVFCGGFDLKLCLAEAGTLATLLQALHATIERIRAMERPVVIAAHGAAIAGGCALLGAGDVVVTDDGAKIGYPVTPLGISPAVSAPSLGAAVGWGTARSRLLDPGLVSGREATRIGLAHECVEKAEQVLARAVAVAGELARKPGGAFKATKRWLNELTDRQTPALERRNALEASLGIAGGKEERERLTALFSR